MNALRRRLFQLIADLTSPRNDRGDVPGWVLVAVMSAGLVTALRLMADDALTGILDRAISSVTGP